MCFYGIAVRITGVDNNAEAGYEYFTAERRIVPCNMRLFGRGIHDRKA